MSPSDVSKRTDIVAVISVARKRSFITTLLGHFKSLLARDLRGYSGHRLERTVWPGKKKVYSFVMNRS